MVAITFPTSSSPGSRPQESAGRLINAFVEKTESGAPGQTLWRRSGGLIYAGSSTTPHTRGFIPFQDTDQLAARERGWATAFWATDNALHMIVENRGTGEYTVNFIAPWEGEASVTMARNHAIERQFVGVTEGGVWVLHSNAPPTPYSEVDTDLPPLATSVCSHDAYFVWSYQNGRIYASEPNSTDVHGDSFNTEQGQAVLRVVSFSGRLYAMGSKWIGVYRDAGTVPFPFLREATIPRGLLSTHAVAGWEPGWANELIWVGDDYIVYKLNGYTPVPISNDALSRDIWTSIEFNRPPEAFVYMFGKNAFWVLNSPGLWTWEYNATTGQWNERRSQGRLSWKGNKSIRGTRDWIIGDQFFPYIYRIREEYFKEADSPEDSSSPTWTVESGVMSGFPLRTVIPRASFNITSAVGRPPVPDDDDPRVAAPTVRIYWSLDGGLTWGNPVIRALGPEGDGRYYPSVICSGLSRGFGIRYRLEVTDAVHVGLAGGEIEVQPRSPV
jgi:hypothetical protein